MARPKADEEKKLAKVVLFRVTDGEMNQLESASEACGQTVGQLVRCKVFKGKFPQPVLARIDKQAIIELNRVGVNLNQITRKLNAGLWPKDILPVLTKLLWVLERILDKLLTNDRKSK